MESTDKNMIKVMKLGKMLPGDYSSAEEKDGKPSLAQKPAAKKTKHRNSRNSSDIVIQFTSNPTFSQKFKKTVLKKPNSFEEHDVCTREDIKKTLYHRHSIIMACTANKTSLYIQAG